MKMLFFLGRGARWSRSRRSKRRWLKPQLKMPQLKHPQRARKSQNTDAGFSTNAHCQARIAPVSTATRGIQLQGQVPEAPGRICFTKVEGRTSEGQVGEEGGGQ